MPKKVTKEINVAVSSRKQGYWINEENKGKSERTIKTKGNKVLVKRNRSGYDYDKTITGYEWTKAELEKKLAERAKKGMMDKKAILRDLTHTHRNTKTAPIITAADIFDNDDWNKQDVLGVDTPPSMTLQEILEGYKILDIKRHILAHTKLTEEELAELVEKRRAEMGEFVTEFGAYNIVARELEVADYQLEKKPEVKDTKSKLAVTADLTADLTPVKQISKPSSSKRLLVDNSYSESKIGFTFKDQPVTDFEIINCTPDEEHKITVPRGYHDSTEERTARWTKKGETLQVFKVTTALGTEYIASIEHDPRAFSMSTHGKINKQSFKSMKEAKQWLNEQTKVPISKMTTEKTDLKELEGMRKEIPIEFDNLNKLKKATTFSDKKEVLLTDATKTLSVINNGIKEMDLEIDKAVKEASKPISDTEVKQTVLKEIDDRYELLKTRGEWVGDADYQRKKAYEQKRLPEIVESIKKTGKYPALPDTHKFRSLAEFKQEYFLTFDFDPEFKKGELEVEKLKDGVPHNDISSLQARHITDNYTVGEHFDKAKKPENKNARFLNEIINKEKGIFDSYVDDRSKKAVKSAKDHVAYVRHHASGDQNEYIHFIKNIHDAEDLNEAYEHRQSFNEIEPASLYNRKNRLGNEFRVLADTGKNTIGVVERAKESRIKQAIKEKGISKLTPAEKEQDFKETSDLTLKSPDMKAYEVWKKQPYILDLEGYDDVKDQAPPERFTLPKAKKYLKQMGADPNKLSISEYGTIHYGKERIGSTDTSRPRSEQLRREVMRGIRGGQIPIDESKRKVTLYKEEKSILNSIGEQKPTAKLLNDYLFGDMKRTTRILKQLEEKRLIVKEGDEYTTTEDGKKAQRLMSKIPTPKKLKTQSDYKKQLATKGFKETIVKDVSTLEEVKPEDLKKLTLQKLPTKTISPGDPPITSNKLGFPKKYSTKDEVAFIRQAIKDEYKHQFNETCKMSIKMSTGTAYGTVTAYGSGDSKDKGITPKEYFVLKKLGFNPNIGGQSVMVLSDNLDKVTKRIDDIQKSRTVSERNIGSEIKELESLKYKSEAIVDNESYANAEDWQRQKIRMIEKELSELQKNKLSPESKAKTKPDTSKAKAAGKNLYQEKYNPGKTHLAKSKTLTDMQKRRLIKACIDNEVDTRELDPSLKYDENQEIIQDMIESTTSQFRDDSKSVDKKIAKLENIYYDDFSKERIKEREIDEKTTEEKVITKEDLSKNRKKTQQDKWKTEPYKSKIDVEEIDTGPKKEKKQPEFKEVWVNAKRVGKEDYLNLNDYVEIDITKGLASNKFLNKTVLRGKVTNITDKAIQLDNTLWIPNSQRVRPPKVTTTKLAPNYTVDEKRKAVQDEQTKTYEDDRKTRSRRHAVRAQIAGLTSREEEGRITPEQKKLLAELKKELPTLNKKIDAGSKNEKRETKVTMIPPPPPTPKQILKRFGSDLPKPSYDYGKLNYPGSMVEFDNTLNNLQSNKSEILALTDLTTEDFENLNKGSRADQIKRYDKVRKEIWSSYYESD